MLILQNVTYLHPNRDLLFSNIHFTLNKHNKVALIGNNGVGKSTLLKIMAGMLQPSSGTRLHEAKPYYIPQHLGEFNDCTIGQALGVDEKINALKDILLGNVTETNLALLNDDWTIEERCREALALWKLDGLNMHQKMGHLSGGQKTKVFLAGIAIHQPEIVLLDEPSNHLDAEGRSILYNYVQSTADTLVVVSHDRTLLNLLTTVCELSTKGIAVYGGNYDFYVEQKALEANAMNEELRNREKELRKAKDIEKATIERQQKLDARGRKKQEKAGLPTISMNTFRNNAEKSTARLKDVHDEKVNAISLQVNQLRKALPGRDKMKMEFDDSSLHTGKILVTARDINFAYGTRLLWEYPLSFQISSKQRMAIKGVNGSGKTTLIKMVLGEISPSSGTIQRAACHAIYIDQDYSLINNRLTVFEQAQQFNTDHLQEHEVKSRLTHFLFTKTYWDKPCKTLSGGEKMRLILCCLTIGNQSPDIIVLDEPTNNLDIQNIEILTEAINAYSGTLIVVSHDAYFLDQIGIEESITLNCSLKITMHSK